MPPGSKLNAKRGGPGRGHEPPWAMSREPSSMHQASSTKQQDIKLTSMDESNNTLRLMDLKDFGDLKDFWDFKTIKWEKIEKFSM